MAAAANLTGVFQEIAAAFERETGIHCVLSFASTSQLAQQIEERAPFDVFAAADVDHAVALESKGLLVPGTRSLYAIGILALWSPNNTAHRLADLTRPEVRVIAIAKPELAPYGKAAVETLQAAGIWAAVKPKIVYAPNVGMVRQYGASGNADAVFTALSLVRRVAGTVVSIDAKMHAPIEQELGVVAGTAHPVEARAFRRYVTDGRGRDILASAGYRVPAAGTVPRAARRAQRRNSAAA